ncbi:dynamin family protein [Bacillus sp. JCM 19034]|uniref:dynamin family protein n=1 Tax=Bacillus sp. JCM 19034 TaxID=1481928 RepID=UPI00078169AC|nr:dynamin family protein [Bacillus sp. JCM 19034]
MKAPDHHLNEWPVVKQQLQSLLYFSKQLIPFANKRLLQGHYLRMILRLQDDCQATIEQLKKEMVAAGYNPKDLEEREGLMETLAELSNAKKSLEEDFTVKFNDLVKNVTLFPYTTTELTRQWLEVMEPGYRAGLFFAKKKTEKVREEYSNRLIAELEDKIKSLLVFHLQAIFQSYPLTQLTNRADVEKEIDQLPITLDAHFFYQAVQKGPKDRNYVFTFTKDRTNAIITILRKKAASVLRLIIIGMEEYWNREYNKSKERLDELNQIEHYVDKNAEIQKDYQDVINEYKLEADKYKDSEHFERKLNEIIQQAPPVFEEHDWKEVALPDDSVIAAHTEEDQTITHKTFDEKAIMEWVDIVKKYGETPGHPVVEEEKKSLLKRVKRFKDRTFTISLFGAFSAGKSSFANALLGESVLPVSPNPTTATVNIVRKSDEQHPNQTAIIQMKSELAIRKEIEFVAKQLELELSFETIHTWNPKKKSATTRWQKTYYSYLEMLQTALKEEQRFELGEKGTVSLEDVHPFIAKEENACLVEKVTVFYNCPLTESGVVLVDTPGVNSIHGRHTQVAFKQVQQSDAIFYITYYNHAFSKADQLFLQQMAKVNEGFREDKLYFVLNAADLAHSRAELIGVRNHILDQLQKNGFKHPRLYSLSINKVYRKSKRGQSIVISNSSKQLFIQIQFTILSS